MTALQQILRSFFGIDSRAIKAFRIGLGCLILSDLWIRLGDVNTFYTDHGVLPRAVLLEHFALPFQISIHAAGGTALFQYLLFAVNAAAAVALIVGYRARWAAFVCWLLCLSLHNRQPMVLSLGDGLLRMLLFWSLFLPLNPPRKEREVLSIGTAGILIQIFLMYLVTAALKTGPSWRDGTALYYAFSIDYISTPFASRLLKHPELLKALTHGAFYLEFMAPWLLLFPFFNRSVRAAAAIVMMIFHLSFVFTIKLGLFPFIDIVALFLFLPGWFWDAAQRTADRCGPLHRLRQNLGAAMQKFLTNGRHVLETARQPARGLPGAIAAFFLVYTILWNLGLVVPRLGVPAWLSPLTQFLRLDQKWTMYVPEPSTFDGWFVVAGKLADGREVDLYRGGKPVDWQKPVPVSTMFKNYRWRKHMTKLAMKGTPKAYIRSYAAYLCREWNGPRPADAPDRLRTVDIHFNIERTRPDYAPPRIKRKLLLSKNC